MSCEVVSGRQRTPLVRAYLPLSTLEQLLYMEEALNQFPGEYNIVLEYLNANIVQLHNLQSQQVVDFLESFVLVDLLSNFRQCLHFRHLKMWWQFRQGGLLRSRCDYVCGLYCRLFETVGISDLKNFVSDHSALRAELLQRPTQCHR